MKQKDIYAISAYTIDSRPKETRTLIKKYGVALPATANQADVDKAFAALLKTSKTFRKEFSQLAQQAISENKSFIGFLNFADEYKGGKSLNDIFVGANADGDKTTNTSGVGISDYLDPDTVKNIINTGLNIWASKSGTTADTSSNINDGRRDIPNNPNTPPPPSKKGLSTGAIVGISLGVLGALGAIIYFATKKK